MGFGRRGGKGGGMLFRGTEPDCADFGATRRVIWKDWGAGPDRSVGATFAA
jgi:hypothetical protein